MGWGVTTKLFWGVISYNSQLSFWGLFFKVKVQNGGFFWGGYAICHLVFKVCLIFW